MEKIQLLSEDVINKIAAGEVIERPASVVKELIENSLDAGATSIAIELKNCGQELISISDNGCGMAQEDANKSLLRHATSKIHSAEDLFAINTLGFRGEALPSIAAVSKLTITTKPKEEMAGYQLTAIGGLISSSKIVASETGTTVEARDLFFNTPARKKFLKTNSVELKHIINVVTNYALLNYKTAFRLIHDNRVLLQAPTVSDLKSRIAALYGMETAKELIKIDYQDRQIKISGMTIKPYFVRNDKQWQTIFVNGRWIRNEDLTAAVYQAYHSLLFVNKHPVFVLLLEIDPQQIDVNVHPSKSDIKIEQKDLVCKTITTAVLEALNKHHLLPEIKLAEKQLDAIGIFNRRTSLAPKYSFQNNRQTVLQIAEKSQGYPLSGDKELIKPTKIIAAAIEKPDYLSELQTHPTLPPLKILGQIHKTFFAAETPGGMFFIDQHAVHERVLYEQFMEQYLQGAVAVQNLLQPEILDFSLSSLQTIAEHRSFLLSLGFDLQEFGNNSVIVKTVPAIFGRIQMAELLPEIIEKLDSSRINSIKEEIITRLACRSAVMAGEVLTNVEIESILKDLAKTKLPFTCPHGRPTMIKVNSEELERKFRRKG